MEKVLCFSGNVEQYLQKYSRLCLSLEGTTKA